MSLAIGTSGRDSAQSLAREVCDPRGSQLDHVPINARSDPSPSIGLSATSANARPIRR